MRTQESATIQIVDPYRRVRMALARGRCRSTRGQRKFAGKRPLMVRIEGRRREVVRGGGRTGRSLVHPHFGECGGVRSDLLRSLLKVRAEQTTLNLERRLRRISAAVQHGTHAVRTLATTRQRSFQES